MHTMSDVSTARAEAEEAVISAAVLVDVAFRLRDGDALVTALRELAECVTALHGLDAADDTDEEP